MYHPQRQIGKLDTQPIPISAFYADTGVTLIDGNEVLQWDDDINGGGVGSQNNRRPDFENSLGGLAPTINFIPATTTPRLFTSVGSIKDVWDDNSAGRGECTIVLHINHNFTGTGGQSLLSGVGGGTTRRWIVRPRNTNGFEVAYTINNAASVHWVRCNALPANTVTVVVISRELDGTTNIYFDGVAQTITLNTIPVGEFIPNIEFICIGDNVNNTVGPGFADQDFDGQVSAVELYDFPMTASQAASVTSTLQARF